MRIILGQTRAVDFLQHALRSQRVHHAWIFSGPKGVGKYTAAVEFARILLDPNATPGVDSMIEADPDGRTSKLINTESHLDLHIIRKERAQESSNRDLRDRKLMNIPLDLLRELIIGGKTSDDRSHSGPAYLTSIEGHGKVFIIDEAELMDLYAQNSLLKTLEEPPQKTYLILITSRPERLLATIHSRCQHVRFGPLDTAAMQTWFDRAKLDVDDQQQEWIARFCEGSPGTALLAGEYGFWQWHLALSPMLDALAAGHFPAEMAACMATLVDDFAVLWVKNHKNASKDAANKDGFRFLLALLSIHARDQLTLCADSHNETKKWLAVIDLLRDAERQLERNVSLKMLLENLVAQWADRMTCGELVASR